MCTGIKFGLITSAKEVMFYRAFVCLSLSNFTQKNYRSDLSDNYRYTKDVSFDKDEHDIIQTGQSSASTSGSRNLFHGYFNIAKCVLFTISLISLEKLIGSSNKLVIHVSLEKEV